MPQKVRIIGVPMDLGQSRRGLDMGPSALRGAGLQAAIKKLGHTVEDIGNLEVKQPEEMPVGEKRAKYLQEIAETCNDIAESVEQYGGCGRARPGCAGTQNCEEVRHSCFYHARHRRTRDARSDGGCAKVRDG